MEWRDEGAVLSVRRHGESAAIVEIFTQEHGRHVGVVRGGAGRRMAPILQPGAQLAVTWKARLEDHIGSYTVEPVKSRAAQVMGDGLALAALGSVTALLSFTLPERETAPAVYAPTMALLDMLGDNPLWPLAYLRWELALLEDMGFGLDLTRCAVTGSREDLAYVSPRTGRAVSRGGAGDWADRLLPLPPSLLGQGPAETFEIAAGLRTTGHFLETWLAPALGGKPLPAARQRFVDAFARQSRSA
ncbi:DNA repair protein RecO [Anianabacter salinae]|uniref:DNA repair protein RecO n=1 Tax=Anianabacter salinae TaxID=2851023 RepID=UPI00225DDA6F|nr:DNA repair protein RecO [Anianabacter salinae]MBV0913198.1 DNA repair protein RecO [Anianabacter salinae]